MTEPKIDAELSPKDVRSEIPPELIERVAKKIGGYAEGYGRELCVIWHSPSFEDRHAVLEFKFAVCDWVFTHPDFIALQPSGSGSFMVNIDQHARLKSEDWFTSILLAADALPAKEAT